MILQSPSRSAGGSFSNLRWNIGLIGVKNGVNNVFTTPESFIQSGSIVIRVYWNGRRLKLNDDYTVSESGGVGTGFDTITFLFPNPPVASSAITADYTPM